MKYKFVVSAVWHNILLRNNIATRYNKFYSAVEQLNDDAIGGA